MDLEARVQRLERQSRWLKVILVCVCILAGVVCVVSQLGRLAGRHEIRANRFVVTDANGRSRATFGFTQSGLGLRLLDQNDNLLAKLAVVDGAPRVELLDKEGVRRVNLGLYVDDDPALILHDADGDMRLVMKASEAGPTLTLLDDNKQSRAILGAFMDTDRYGDSDPVQRPESSLRMYDPDGELLWTCP